MYDNTKAVIEALLFASEKPLALEQIKKVLDGADVKQIRKVLDELNCGYEANNCGIRVVEIAGGFRMTTPAALSPFIKKLYKERRTERLSKPALETLAIIAYKQPLTKMEIESLRNVNVDGVISSLLDKDFIHITGRKNAPGRPLVFGTTRQFLEYFGLKSLSDLPKMEDFSELSAVKQETEVQEENRQPDTRENGEPDFENTQIAGETEKEDNGEENKNEFEGSAQSN